MAYPSGKNPDKKHTTKRTSHRIQPIGHLAVLAVLTIGSMAVSACQHQMPKNSPTTSKPVAPSLQQQVAHTLIVMYGPTVNKDALNKVIGMYQGTITHQYTIINGLAVRFPDKTPMMAVAKQLRAVPGVTSVEFDSVQTIQPVTDAK